jgi:Flp pilus assembly CpaF family ATPase
MLAHYIQAHLDTPNPFVEGRLTIDGPTYHSKIHAAATHNVNIPPPPITAELLWLLQTDYMNHNHMRPRVTLAIDH